MNYVGINHHKQYSHITWLNEKGEVVKSGGWPIFGKSWRHFSRGLGCQSGDRSRKIKLYDGRCFADLGIETDFCVNFMFSICSKFN